MNHMPTFSRWVRALRPRAAQAQESTARALRPRSPALCKSAVSPTCGWFDSSHELERGLFVVEHDSPDGPLSAVPIWHGVDGQGRRRQC